MSESVIPRGRSGSRLTQHKVDAVWCIASGESLTYLALSQHVEFARPFGHVRVFHPPAITQERWPITRNLRILHVLGGILQCRRFRHIGIHKYLILLVLCSIVASRLAVLRGGGRAKV